jgi:hypothetical protein
MVGGGQGPTDASHARPWSTRACRPHRDKPVSPRETIRRALQHVARISVASGALQTVAPGLTLDRLSLHPDPLSRHLFSTVGMFMVVSGGSLSAALGLPVSDAGPALAWCAAQKVGAAAAVAIGVRRRVLSPAALGVAAFDLASGLLILDYRRRLSR